MSFSMHRLALSLLVAGLGASLWVPLAHAQRPPSMPGTPARTGSALATVWAPYAFYLDGRLSHCGVNAFQLIRRPQGWRIVSLIDTRRTEGCEIPPDVQPRR